MNEPCDGFNMIEPTNPFMASGLNVSDYLAAPLAAWADAIIVGQHEALETAVPRMEATREAASVAIADILRAVSLVTSGQNMRPTVNRIADMVMTMATQRHRTFGYNPINYATEINADSVAIVNDALRRAELRLKVSWDAAALGFVVESTS